MLSGKEGCQNSEDYNAESGDASVSDEILRINSVVTVQDLTDDEMLMIFTFLSIEERKTIALICKRWKQLVYSPCFWADVKVFMPLHCSEKEFKSLGERNIKSVTCDRGTEEEVSLLFDCLPDLSSVTFDELDRIADYEKFLPKQLSKLKHLKVWDLSTVEK